MFTTFSQCVCVSSHPFTAKHNNVIKISLMYCRDWGSHFISACDQLAKDETGSLRREFVLLWHCCHTYVCWSE